MIVSGGLWLSRWRAVSMPFLVRGTYEYANSRGNRWRRYRETSSMFMTISRPKLWRPEVRGQAPTLQLAYESIYLG